MQTLRVETLIEAPVRTVFDLARSLRVHPLTTAWTGERVVSSHSHDLLEVGDVVTFEARHFGIKQKLTARVVEMDPPHFFSDEMVKGAFRSLRHEHHFAESGGGTLMADVLTIAGPLGSLFDRLILEPYMRKFLIRRGSELKKLAEDTHAL